MHRLLQVMWMLVLFELGVFLLFLPWFPFWDANYFLSHYPALRPFLLQPALRGTVSGLGALDIVMAAKMIRRRPASGTAPQTQRQSF